MWHKIKIIVSLLFIGFILTHCDIDIEPDNAYTIDAKWKSKIIAHCGYWNTPGSTPNSIKSLEMASQTGVYGSEFDVHLTKDNVLVVNHNNDVAGINIQTSNYDAIKNCILSNGEKIPTLRQYLEKGRELEIRMILEIKPHRGGRNRDVANAVINMVSSLGMTDKVEYITNNRVIGKIIIDRGGRCSYLNGDMAPRELKQLGFAGLDYDYSVIKKYPEYINEAKSLGLTTNVWVVNDIKTIRNMIALGVDFITIDIPHDAKNVFK